MKPQDVATLLQIGRSTVTTWTMGEFKEYFTPGAQGGSGRPRNLTEIDVRILHLIDEMKKSNVPGDEIHAALRRLRDDDWQGLPDMPSAGSGTAVVPVMPTAAADAAVSTLLRENNELRQRMRDLENKIDALHREAKADLAAERSERDTLLRELGDVRAKLERASAIIELYEQGRLKPNE
jgi:DNA-binding transcriptional MerR regulator